MNKYIILFYEKKYSNILDLSYKKNKITRKRQIICKLILKYCDPRHVFVTNSNIKSIICKYAIQKCKYKSKYLLAEWIIRKQSTMQLKPWKTMT